MLTVKSEIAIELSKLRDFENPRISLEQYMTPPELAADIIHSAFMNGDIEDHRILDAGAGTGILGIGAALAGAGEVVAVEKDEAAVKILKENLDNSRTSGKVKVRHEDIEEVDEQFDTVLMNPPFSTHSETGTVFIEKALELADNVYAVGHPGLEDEFRRLADEHRIKASEGYTISLPATYGFHTEESRETPVRVVVATR